MSAVSYASPRDNRPTTKRFLCPTRHPAKMPTMLATNARLSAVRSRRPNPHSVSGNIVPNSVPRRVRLIRPPLDLADRRGAGPGSACRADLADFASTICACLQGGRLVQHVRRTAKTGAPRLPPRAVAPFRGTPLRGTLGPPERPSFCCIRLGDLSQPGEPNRSVGRYRGYVMIPPADVSESAPFCIRRPPEELIVQPSAILRSVCGVASVFAFIGASLAGTAEQPVFPFKIQKAVLDNGLTVITVPCDTPGVLSYYTIVRTGSRNEVEPGLSGFAHFFEHMMFRGTPRNSNEQYNAKMKATGRRFERLHDRRLDGLSHDGFGRRAGDDRRARGRSLSEPQLRPARLSEGSPRGAGRIQQDRLVAADACWTRRCRTRPTTSTRTSTRRSAS